MFVKDIKFCNRDSDFVKKHGMYTDCYVVHCRNHKENDVATSGAIDRYLMIMKSMVGAVLF